MTPEKLPTAYLYGAALVTNTLIVFLLVNVALAAFFHVRDHPASNQAQPPISAVRKDTPFFNEDGSPVDNGKRTSYELRSFDYNAYENIDPVYAAEVLDSFWGLSKMGFIYEPFVGFSEPPFASRLVNVDIDAHGFPIRRTVNHKGDPDKPTVSIFAMGGSPTFGYNVSDEHTWASHLSKILSEKAEADQLGINVEVVNYGKGYYYPSQETALLVDLLRSGQRPSLVVFMDGVNLGPPEDVPHFTDELAREMINMQFRPPPTEQLSWLPIVRLSNALRRRLFHADTEPERPKEPPISQRVDRLVNMFDRNMEMSTAVANLYGTKTLFFLQPNVAYRYSTKLFRTPVSDVFVEDRSRTEMLYKRLSSETGRIDVSDLFEKWGKERKAVVDDCHYSPAFAEFLARRVADHIDLRSLKPRAKVFDESAAGGGPRQSYFLKTH